MRRRASRSPWRERPIVASIRSRWALISLATLFYWVANQAIRPFVPLRMEHLGASDLVVGTAVASSAVAALLFAVPSGRLLDRLPQRNALITSLIGLSVSTAALAAPSSVAVLVLLMLVQGVFAMWVWLILQSMITHAGVGEVRTQNLALFSLTWGVGLAAGPSVGAFAFDSAGFFALCLTCGAICLAGAFVSIPAPPVLPAERPEVAAATETDDSFRATLGRSFTNPVLVSVLLSSFVNIYVQSMRLSFYPIYLARMGVTVPSIGLLLSLIGISSLVVRAVLPPAIRRWGVYDVLIWSTWLAIAGVVLTPISSSMWVLVTGALLIGVGLGANPPITVNLIAEHSGATDRGVAVALRMVANRSAQVVQPLLFGGMASVVGLALAFPASGVILAGLTVWMSARLRPLRRAATSVSADPAAG